MIVSNEMTIGTNYPHRRRTALIQPYFGCFPRWINLYFKTCSAQQDFQWLVFTDQDPAAWSGRYDNISFTRLTLDDFFARAREMTGCNARGPCHPKKVCDFRPLFGKIFSNELRDYEFWGHVDHDLFVGRLGTFLQPHLDANDVLSTHHSRIAGPLTVYRNIEVVNNLFRTIPNWTAVLMDTERQHYCEEEHFSRAVHQASAAGQIRACFAVGPTAHDGSPFKCVYNEGRVLREQTTWGRAAELAKCAANKLSRGRIDFWPIPMEFIYFHFRLWKSDSLRYDFDETRVTGWRIGTSGISVL